ncbi:MAG: ATP-grasp domain-containing protein [Planctomycetes bacterium]|nr:ATP-grasp domain-containing protein [Planctomycetota bacterium]
MRITVLTDLDKKKDPRSYDKVVDQVVEALVAGGHEASILGVHRDLHALIDGLTKPKPDLVFNLFENFGKVRLGAVCVVGLLDLLEVPYVGGGPGEFFLQQDKGITKKLLAFEGVPFPKFAVFTRESNAQQAAGLRMPLIVKPLSMDASIGISPTSIVSNEKDLMKRVAMIHDKVKDDALVEEFIDGREFNVAVIGNLHPIALPPMEIDFSGLPERAARILDSRAKWDEDSVRFKGTRAVLADIPTDLKLRLEEIALAAFRALHVRDYGRVDLRVDADGNPYVIEVNASCYLEQTSEFATAAAAGGIPYQALILRLVDGAVERLGLKPAPVVPAAPTPSGAK